MLLMKPSQIYAKDFINLFITKVKLSNTLRFTLIIFFFKIKNIFKAPEIFFRTSSWTDWLSTICQILLIFKKNYHVILKFQTYVPLHIQGLFLISGVQKALVIHSKSHQPMLFLWKPQHPSAMTSHIHSVLHAINSYQPHKPPVRGLSL